MIFQILQVIENDEQYYAIEQIYYQHYERMVAACFKILHNTSDAEDAAMDAFRYMSDNPEKFLQYQSSYTVGLVYLCAKQMAIGIYRKNKMHRNKVILMEEQEDFEALPDLSQDLMEIIVVDETKQMLAQAMKRLDFTYRLPILLKYNYRMRNVDIADLTKENINTVNGRIHRAKKMLQKYLIEMGYEYEKTHV